MKFLTLLTLLLSASAFAEVNPTDVKVVKQKTATHMILKKYEIESPEKSGPTVVKALNEVYSYIQANNLKEAGHARTLYSKDKKTNKYFAEIGVPVANFPKKRSKDFRYTDIPKGNMAVITHKGSYDDVNKSYDELEKWVKTNKKKTNGNAWEVYINSPAQVAEAELLTEVQVLLK